MSENTKYEITNIQHPVFFDLYRIRALRDIGDDVKAGDLGGFVESEKNLSFEPGDNAWIYDDAHASGNARVLFRLQRYPVQYHHGDPGWNRLYRHRDQRQRI